MIDRIVHWSISPPSKRPAAFFRASLRYALQNPAGLLTPDSLTEGGTNFGEKLARLDGSHEIQTGSFNFLSTDALILFRPR